MTVKEYKEQLRDMHDTLKENPFRRGYEVNSKYGKGYYDAVYKFAETFYHLTKDLQRDRIKAETKGDEMLGILANDCLFIHDFYAAINRSRNAISRYEDKGDRSYLDIIHEEEELLELCISCVHEYLDTGFVYRYPFAFHDTIKWAEWNEERNDYAVLF